MMTMDKIHNWVNRSTPVRHLKNLKSHNSGVALIEFAFAAPIALSLGLTGLETTNLAVANMQVSQIAMLVADNASRVRESIDEADIREIFTGADLTGKSINFSANARIILSSLEHNGQAAPDEGQYIRWQRCYGANTNYTSSFGAPGDGQTDSSLANGIGPTGKKISAPKTVGVNFVEVVYDYQPLITNQLFGARVIRYQSAFLTRERTDQVLKNASAIPAGDLWTCNRYAVVT